jgi:hypothetical protein
VSDNDQPPFSEAAALRELEELQREIEQFRVRRKDANDAFDQFLRSFDRSPAQPPAPTSRVAERVEPDDTTIVRPLPSPSQAPALDDWPPPDPPPVVEPALALRASAPQATESATAIAAFPTESDVRAVNEAAMSAEAAAEKTLPRQPPVVPAALTSARPRRSGRIPPAIGLVAVLAAGAAAFFVWRMTGSDPPAPTGATTAGAPVSRAQQPPAPSAAPSAPAVPAAEVSTLRRVWVRVMVDGQKVIERELPADARIPLTPTSQVVVRAGDAGAVRVAIAGKDQGPVGRDGEVATKSFTVAIPARR